MKRQLYRLAVLAVCCVFFCATALAAGCSLRVSIEDENKNPVPDISVEVCQVTAFDGESHSLLEEFAELDLTAEELSRERTAEQAERVYQYILAKELSGTIVLTDGMGAANFTSLGKGIYLVFERGGQVLSFSPYLVSLPTWSEGDWYYHLTTTPKTISTDSRSIMVMVLWEDQEDAAGLRPDHVQVTLYRDGVAIRTVVLNEDCQWQHTFTMLPGSGVYSVLQTSVQHYATRYEEVAEGFLVINAYDPDGDDPDPPWPPIDPDDHPDPPSPPIDPDEIPGEPELPEEPQPNEPTLPQTGFRIWPVYLLLLLGAALVIWGLAEVLFAKEEP